MDTPTPTKTESIITEIKEKREQLKKQNHEEYTTLRKRGALNKELYELQSKYFKETRALEQYPWGMSIIFTFIDELRLICLESDKFIKDHCANLSIPEDTKNNEITIQLTPNTEHPKLSLTFKDNKVYLYIGKPGPDSDYSLITHGLNIIDNPDLYPSERCTTKAHLTIMIENTETYLKTLKDIQRSIKERCYD